MIDPSNNSVVLRLFACVVYHLQYNSVKTMKGLDNPNHALAY